MRRVTWCGFPGGEISEVLTSRHTVAGSRSTKYNEPGRYTYLYIPVYTVDEIRAQRSSRVFIEIHDIRTVINL